MARWVRDGWRHGLHLLYGGGELQGGAKKKECNEAMTKAITGVPILIGGVRGEGVAQLQ